MTKDEFIFSKLWPDRKWHRRDRVAGRVSEYKCTCGTFCVNLFHLNCHLEDNPNPDFTTWDGFGMLLEGMQVSGGITLQVGNRSISLPANILLNLAEGRDAVYQWLGGENGKTTP